MCEAGTNIDYLKLAKANLEYLRTHEDTTHPRASAIQVATLAVQIAQVEALQEDNRLHREWLSINADELRCVHNISADEECPDCQDAPPPEEDTGEDCIHGLNVGSDPRCSLCVAAVPEECQHNIPLEDCSDCALRDVRP